MLWYRLGMLLIPLVAATTEAQVTRDVHTSLQPRVVGPAAGERRLLRDGRSILLKVGPTNGGAGYLFLGSEDMPPGSRVPRHQHHLDEEILIVHRGTLTVTLNDSAHVATAGSVIYLPPGTWVAVENRGPDVATIMFVFPRGSVERCFQYIGWSVADSGKTIRRSEAEQAEEHRACQMTYR
jgi:quercetin dioxygenase-like cupin family protein